MFEGQTVRRYTGSYSGVTKPRSVGNGETSNISGSVSSVNTRPSVSRSTGPRVSLTRFQPADGGGDPVGHVADHVVSDVHLGRLTARYA